MCVFMVLVNIFMFNSLIFIKQKVCIDCGKNVFMPNMYAECVVHRNGGCGMHGFTGMVCAECTVSPEWWVRNARFHRNGGCGMHCSTGMIGAHCTVQPG